MDTSHTGAPRAGLCVVVSSDLRLLSEAVTAAIDRPPRIRASRVPWPSTAGGASKASLAQSPADVALLVCDPPTVAGIAAVERLLRGFRGRSLVMTGSRATPWWGGMLAAGADAVVASTASLDSALDQLEALARGADLIGPVERQVLTRQWLAAQADRTALLERLSLLSVRERQILELLHQGLPAAAVAVRSGVSVATVRTQIRAILVKLEVSSQLAAVALLESVRAGISVAP